MPSKKVPKGKSRSGMQDAFASPFRNQNKPLENALLECLQSLDQLRPSDTASAAWLGKKSGLAKGLMEKSATLPQDGLPLSHLIQKMSEWFEGLPNWGHPLNLSNVCPQQNIASVVASTMSQIFSPNILEGEYAWNTAQAELESSAILANLAGWNSRNAGGVYTYGGSGCWLYHLKYALSRVLPGSREKGIRTDAKVICSNQAHYAMLNSTDWGGLGTKNVIQIRTIPGSNEMDLVHLEEVLQDCTKRSIPIASVVCTMATTDANAFDPVRKIRQLLNKYPNGKSFGKALLYCDAVIGWSWLNFKDYDFEKNPFLFSDHTFQAIQHNYQAIKDIRYADAFGVDFHKCFSPIGSSVFIYKNAREFEKLLKRDDAAYLQARSPYNPHDYTLEVSRPAGGSMAGWATLHSLGATGFQQMLGGILEKKMYLMKRIKNHSNMVVVNQNDTGFATLIRVYPSGENAASEFDREMEDKSYRRMLLSNNKRIEAIGEKLWEWFRKGKLIKGKPCAYLSVTKGFRPAAYATAEDKKAVVFAIKVYPVSVFITEESMDHAIDCIAAAQAAIDSL